MSLRGSILFSAGRVTGIEVAEGPSAHEVAAVGARELMVTLTIATPTGPAAAVLHLVLEQQALESLVRQLRAAKNKKDHGGAPQA